MEGLISLLCGCTEAPGVYRVSRFQCSDHLSGVTAGLLANPFIPVAPLKNSYKLLSKIPAHAINHSLSDTWL